MGTKQILFVTMIGLAPVIAAQAQNTVRFPATIRAGEHYTHAIGHNLQFSIDQEDQGSWNFRIDLLRGKSENYIACLGSPVLHGPDATDLLAWRFSPDAGAGWFEHLPTTKSFSFVMTAADQKYECANQSAMSQSFQRAQASGAEEDYTGLPNYRPRLVGKGIAVIQSVVLQRGLRGEKSAFQQVVMQVVIHYPPHKREIKVGRTLLKVR